MDTGLLPGLISECSLVSQHSDVCMSDETLQKINILAGGYTSAARQTIINKAKAVTHCATENCVLDSFAPALGAGVVRREKLNFKLSGPTDDKLLNNFNIDDTLRQWRAKFPNFFAYNFNMKNYIHYSFRHGQVIQQPDSLATVQFTDFYNSSRGAQCAACVINSDVYQGGGKHWMALFVDCRAEPITIEFFNSAGSAPEPEWVNWMEKMKSQVEEQGLTAKIVRVTTIRHQRSMTECGLYSLFYIWARLHSIPYKYFAENTVPDKLMFEFRQHLFTDPTMPAMKKFNWDEYQKKVRVKWEK